MGLLSIIALLLPLVAVLVGTKLGDGASTGFLAWFLTALISCIVYATLISIMAIMSGFSDPLTITSNVLMIIGIGLINGLFYGCIALLFGRRLYK